MVDAAGLNPVALHRGVWVRIPPSVPHPPISWLSGILSLSVEGWSEDRSFILAFDVAQNLSLPRGVGFGAPFPCPSVYFRGLVWGGVGVRVRLRGPRF